MPCIWPDDALGDCPHATLQISKVMIHAIRFRIDSPTRSQLILTLTRKRCFWQGGAITWGYSRNGGTVPDSTFTLVVDRPIDLPGLSAVVRGLPNPIQLIRGDVLPDHSLQDAVSNLIFHLSLQNHLAVLELPDEVQVAAFVVDPGLLPETRS